MSSSGLTNWDEKKRSSLGQLLQKAARLTNERAVERIRAAGAGGLRASHTALLPHLDLDGTRLSVLAERMGVSKQAVGELVEGLEALGVVRRVPDLDDARARRVCFTKRGLQALEHGLGVLGALEAEWTARLGERRVSGLKRDLAAIIALLEAEEPPPAGARRRR